MTTRIGQRITENRSFSSSQEWLGSRHGTEHAETGTISGPSFRAVFPTGEIPSGTVISRDTATGRYVYGAGAGGTDLPGFLLEDCNIGAAAPADATQDVYPVAVLWHGSILSSKLPTNAGLTAGARTALTLFRIH